MLDRLRLVAAFLLVAVGAWICVGPVLAQDAPEPEAEEITPLGDRDTPRLLFDGFMRAVNDHVKRGPQLDRLDDAADFLDLQGLDDLLGGDRQQGARDLAIRFKAVLDYHGYIEPKDLPHTEFKRSTFVVSTAEGPIIANRGEGGWKFSSDTLAAVDEMIAGFESVGATKYELKTLRDRMPKALLGRALFWEHWQWLGLVALIVICWIGDRILVFFVRQVVGGVLRRKQWLEGPAKAVHLASRPLGLFAVAVVIWVAHPYLDMPTAPFQILAKFFASLAGVLVLYRCADVVAERMETAAEGTESKLDDQLVPLVRKSMKIVICIGGVLFILDNLDVNIWSLMTGLGIFGLGVGLAAKDTMANLFGSFTVFTDRPFQVGDWIIVGSVEGTVEEVGFRSTRVRTFYNSLVSVPNSSVVNTSVDNLGQRTYRRFKTMLGVTYDTPPEKIEAFCAGIRDLVRANEHMRQDYFLVYLNSFGPSSLDILVYVFFHVPGWDDELREKQNFMLEILRLAGAMGVEFAYPSQSLYVESMPDRPKASQAERPIDELDDIRKRFAKGGADARPGGTDRWSTRTPE